MNIIFCHGVRDVKEMTYYPNKRWKYWLQYAVEAEHDVIMQMPQFPHACIYDMKYDEWVNIMDTYKIDENTTLIGHSAGGGFILKYLSLNPQIHTKQIILVSPWMDTTHFTPHKFYEGFEIDTKLADRTINGIDLIVSDNDPIPEISGSTKKISEEIDKIRIHNLPNRGHIIDEELPEIMQIIKFD
ncbi:MAG: alpha/beta hydrolase [Rickettsiales bacterium]|jgi:predicted alpha/beta hydrolase family esterase|nr:alpha/beta hydrolase [Rickettsiales bacterium]